MTETAERVETTRPALDVLDRDQDRILYNGSDSERVLLFPPLLEGFETYLEALSWYQAAGIRTLGHVESVLEPADIMPESSVMNYLTGDDQEERYIRQRLVESLDDACELAYRQFRERANERVQTESGESSLQTYMEISPEDEHSPLMRPAFRKLDTAQAVALRQLWSGFESRSAVSRWVRMLSATTNGNKPEGLMDDIIASEVLLEALCDPTSDSSKLTRYRFAVGEVLPAFLDGASTLRGNELPRGKPDPNPFNEVSE